MSVSTDEHLIVHRPDHAERSVALLYRQHKGKPRIEALVKALALGVQELENLCWAVIAGGGLDAAEGETLRRWGEIVGEVQGGLTHEQYRTFIELRARVNTLFPSEDVLWSLLDEALQPFNVTTRWLVSDGIVFECVLPEMPSLPVQDHTAALIRDARPIGIYVPVVVATTSSFDFEDPFESPFARLVYDGRSRSV